MLEKAAKHLAFGVDMTLTPEDWTHVRDAWNEWAEREAMANERDTHFKNFARLLFDELPEQPYDDSVSGILTAEWKERSCDLIAKRAYDLVFHAMMHLEDLEPHQIILYDSEYRDYVIKTLPNIPDITAFPEEDK